MERRRRRHRPEGQSLSDRLEVERLLEASLLRRGRRLPARELRVETALTGLFVVLSALLAMAAPGVPEIGAPALFAFVAYAIASRVDYPIATGVAVPTQLFLVVLFAHASPALVPLLALGGLAAGTGWAALRGRSRWDRMWLAGGDAMHTLGPAAVLALGGYVPGELPLATLVAVAFAAQCGVEFAASTARDWLVEGIRPRIQLLVMAQVWVIDAALTPVGLLAAAATDELSLAPLGMLPLVALAAHAARDRTERTERLRTRLEDLQRERRRLQVAVRRIGEAFASTLDLDAVVRIVGRAAAEALDAEAARAALVVDGELVTRLADGDRAELVELVEQAQRGALEAGGAATVEREADTAVAAGIGPPGAPVAVVALGRARRAFTAEELELLGYLCEQAGVAAASALRHEALHQQALTDELTGLANHRRLQEVLREACTEHGSTGRGVALVLLDVDDFKLVNDSYGHQTGDLVLRRIGRCLRALCREADEPARYGGEELAVVLTGADAEQAAAFAERVRQAIETMVVQTPDGERLPVTVSVGLALAGSAATTPAALIAAADEALYDAKRAGKNRVRAARPSTARRRRADLESDLREVLELGQLQLAYQPKVGLRDGAVHGAEALLRWRHPQQGMLAPARFLAYLEGSELMPRVTAWVLERAAAQAVAWRAAGLEIPVAVNVTAEDLAGERLPAAVAEALERAGARPGDLRIEITEQLAAADSESSIRALRELRAMGIGLSLDDFGSGYSSLTRLRDLPVDELKLDRSFLRASETRADQAVVQAAISLGRELGLTVVAEGVEDAYGFETMRRLGCDLAQGFHIAAPLLAGGLERWAAARAAGAAALAA